MLVIVTIQRRARSLPWTLSSELWPSTSTCLLPGLSSYMNPLLPQRLFIPPVNWPGYFVHRPTALGKPSRKPRGCQLLWNWPRGVGPIGSCLCHPDPLLRSGSGNSDCCVLLEGKKKISKTIPTSGRNAHWNRMRQK